MNVATIYSNWILLWVLLWYVGITSSVPALSAWVALIVTIYLVLRYGALPEWIALSLAVHILPVYLTRNVPWNTDLEIQAVAACSYVVALYVATGYDPVTYYTQVVPGRWFKPFEKILMKIMSAGSH